MERKKRIVIVGGGFGGQKAAKMLCSDPALEILLLDQRNYHLFQPLLYQVATAALNPSNISSPIRSLFSKAKNVSVLMLKADSVDLANKTVWANQAAFSYDYLILACGSQHTYFGHNDWEENAPGLKNLEQALEIRGRILSAYENAEKESSPKKQQSYLTFVIVGGGPTGVEMAGAVAEIARNVLEKDFRNIDPSQTKIILIEALEHILPSFAPKLALKAEEDLRGLGVELRTSSLVKGIDATGIYLENEKIEASTVLWTAGVYAAEINKSLGVELDRQGRVIVESDLSLKGHPEVFVIGDAAHAKDERGNPLPGIATVALQQGRYVGKLILNELKGKSRVPFRFRNKGMAATIGKHKALIEMGKLKFSGYFAWLIWLFIHVWYLTGGIENRVQVLIQWAWSYMRQHRGARIIYTKDWRFYSKK